MKSAEAHEHLVCLVTAPAAQAGAIAAAVVEAELAACVNIVAAVESVYRWEGRVARDTEALLVVKTTRAALSRLTEAIRAIHPYENFELVALDIFGGSEPYLRWIEDSVR